MSEEPSSKPRKSALDAVQGRNDREWHWRLEDVMDFEFFLESDREIDPAALERRDRKIYREHLAPLPSAGENKMTPIRRRLFRQWLEIRRREEPLGFPWPGSILASARRIVTGGLAGVGLVLGAGAAAQLLRYDGVQPVNVAAFFGWLVLLQLLLSLLAASGMLLRPIPWVAPELSLLNGLLRRLWVHLAARLAQPALDKIPGERRAQCQSFLGILSARGSLYRSALVWPLVSSWQLFGLCFNVGVIGVTLALVLFSDRAFGWQSAVQFSAEQVHDLIRNLALPWSSIFPEGTGYPTLAHVEGSRIILKDGIRQLATEHLVSWWPFLCLATLTYGLLPRLGFLLFSGILGRRALNRLPFDHVACDRLDERLRSEDFETRGLGVEPKRTPLPEESVSSARGTMTAPTEMVPEQGALLLIEPELQKAVPVTVWRDPIARRFQLDPFQVEPVAMNPSELSLTLGALTQWRWRDGQPKIVILQEAWEPPIAENINALRLLRKTFGPSAKIIVALIGRPQGQNHLTPVKESEGNNWERQLNALGDPKLRVDALVPPPNPHA